MIPAFPSSLYRGVLGALENASTVSLFFFAGAASALETREGFDGAADFLRGVDWSQGEALRRRVLVFLEKREIEAALRPHLSDLAPLVGVDPVRGTADGRGERPRPWWFEARHPLKTGGGMMSIEEGAIAVGDERALDWLLKVRGLAEAGGCPSGFSDWPHLFWLPELSAQAVQLNRYGRVYRPETETFETVNEETRALKIRALFPHSLRSGREQASAAMALTTFQHQFWTETPETLQDRLGPGLWSRLPERLLVHQHHFLHPQAVLLPGFGQALTARFAARIVFFQAGKVWLGRPTGEGVQDRTDEAPEEWVSYFRRLAGLASPVYRRPPTGRGVPEELPESGPGQRAERIIVPTNEEGRAALDSTQPLKADDVEALRTAMRLPYDTTSPVAIPALPEEEIPTRPARGLLELLGRIFMRRPKDPSDGAD